jgi:hypothetical protein
VIGVSDWAGRTAVIFLVRETVPGASSQCSSALPAQAISMQMLIARTNIACVVYPSSNILAVVRACVS